MTRSPMRMLLGLTLCLGLVACGGDEDDDVSVADQPLQGLAFGQDWEIVGATTNAFLSDEDGYWVDAYVGEPMCGGFGQGGDRPKLIITVPRSVGTYRLSLTQNMTFSFMSDNLVATDGVIIVEAITDTEITVAMRAHFDGDNSVEGRFVAQICPE